MKKALLVAATLLITTVVTAGVPGHITEAVNSPDRTEKDTARDPDRKPAEVLSFFGIGKGMKVVDCMTGAGYYAELVAGAVGSEGHVWAQINKAAGQFYSEPLAARLEKPGLANVTRIDSELDAPGLPGDLDAVLLIRFYHDFFWMGADRAAFNKAVFDALEPGGVYGVIDHHAEEGSGARDAKDPRGLHRIDAALVRAEIEAAGFVLEAEADFLRNPDDTRDWFIYADNAARVDKTDRFVYRFRKPKD